MNTEKVREVLRLWLTLLAFPKVYDVVKVLVGDPLDKAIEITNEVLGADVSPATEPVAVSPGEMAMNAAGSIFVDGHLIWWPQDKLTQGQAEAMRQALEIVNKEMRSAGPDWEKV